MRYLRFLLVLVACSGAYMPLAAETLEQTGVCADTLENVGYRGSVEAGTRMYGTRWGGYGVNADMAFRLKDLDIDARMGYDDRRIAWHSENQYEVAGDTLPKQLGRGNWATQKAFAEIGLIWHLTNADRLSFGLKGLMGSGKGSFMYGSQGDILPHRDAYMNSSLRMFDFNLDYRHSFAPNHYLDFKVAHESYDYAGDTRFCDSVNNSIADTTSWDRRIMDRTWHVAFDYGVAIDDRQHLFIGYNGTFAHDSSRTRMFSALGEETNAYDFKYRRNIHSAHVTYVAESLGNWNLLADFKAEAYEMFADGTFKNHPVRKPFRLLYLPDVQLSYKLPKYNQLRMAVSRDVRYPHARLADSYWGVTNPMVSFLGNAKLAPELINKVDMGYLQNWERHRLDLTAYYHLTQDVIQCLSYNLRHTLANLSNSTTAGLKVETRNYLYDMVDLSTTVDVYYHRLGAFEHIASNGHLIHCDAHGMLTWYLRMKADVELPQSWNLGIQAKYNAKDVIAQGYIYPYWRMDVNLHKLLNDGKWRLSLDVNNLLNSRKIHVVQKEADFMVDSKYVLAGCCINVSAAYNFGNLPPKRIIGENIAIINSTQILNELNRQIQELRRDEETRKIVEYEQLVENRQFNLPTGDKYVEQYLSQMTLEELYERSEEANKVLGSQEGSEVAEAYKHILDMMHSVRGAYDKEKNQEFKTRIKSVSPLEVHEKEFEALRVAVNGARFSMFELGRVMKVVDGLIEENLSPKAIHDALVEKDETRFIDRVPYSKMALDKYIQIKYNMRSMDIGTALTDLIGELKIACPEAFTEF